MKEKEYYELIENYNALVEKKQHNNFYVDQQRFNDIQVMLLKYLGGELSERLCELDALKIKWRSKNITAVAMTRLYFKHLDRRKIEQLKDMVRAVENNTVLAREQYEAVYSYNKARQKQIMLHLLLSIVAIALSYFIGAFIIN